MVSFRSRMWLALPVIGATLLTITFGPLPARATGAATPPRPTSASEVTLITGERVLQTQDAAGRYGFTILSGGASSSPVFTYGIGSSRYVVDAAALPFIGSQLDAALFDSATATAGSTPGEVAVLVAWHGAAAPSMSWLNHQHTASHGMTSGIITAASGVALRSALAQQPRSSRGTGWAGPLAGIDRILLDGAATSPPPPSPQFVQYTLTINGIDSSGRLDSGDLLTILNTDNAQKLVNFAIWNQGVIKLSVPSGHYSLLGQFLSFTKSGGGSLRNVVSDITVNGTGSVTLDARTATSPVSVTTPLPTPSGSGTVLWQRTDATGNDVVADGFSWMFAPGQPFSVYVRAAPAPRFGTQGWVDFFHLDSPPTVPGPYSYDLNFGSQGSIPAAQQHTVSAAQLASVTTRYYSDISGLTSGESRSAFFPWQVFSGGFIEPFSAPMGRTEYVNALSGLTWDQIVIEDLNDFAGLFMDSSRSFQPGQSASAAWGRSPTGPGLQVNTGAAAPFQLCPVCLEAGMLEFSLYPFGDNPPGHVGIPNFGAQGFIETDSASLQRNGVTIVTGQDPIGAVSVPPGGAHYLLSYAVTMSAPWWTLSTSSTTTWKFSAPQSLSTPPPAGWTCFSGLSFGCSVVTLMFPDYELPVNLLNQIPVGPVSFQLGIVHVLDVAIPITRASVSVSFDRGSTWQPAHVHPDGTGGFTVSYRNPSGASTASLRIHVSDANGGAIDQTIINAYAISG
ncbi:MAG: hypothetical protein M3070_02125 [Actinomycetota bacterium]|nr:hypothetical protein [Actinomycetota bacterium]